MNAGLELLAASFPGVRHDPSRSQHSTEEGQCQVVGVFRADPLPSLGECNSKLSMRVQQCCDVGFVRIQGRRRR